MGNPLAVLLWSLLPLCCSPLAHLALVAALIRARPAAEMRRLGEIETIFLCPFTLAQRALCAAAILARAAALIVRRLRLAPVLFIPFSALIAVSSALTCCATLSRSALEGCLHLQTGKRRGKPGRTRTVSTRSRQ